ncbi:MAG: NTP/NDP exchange transporter [Rickettsiales bacterium]|nr:NTP/NDP exchange transporter [Rickettsiales bacterium]
MVKRLVFFLIPIHKEEYKKFLSMGMMLFLVLFNYNILRALKDAFIVPNIGAEAISFIKMYMVTPAALLFAIFYAYLTNVLDFNRIFYLLSSFFLIFFLLFCFVLYPYLTEIHPSPEQIQYLINSHISIASFTIHLDHFKWFFKIYGKWLYTIFYIFAELWGSAMIFMLYWQFANRITNTEEAKRLYPMCGFIGHIGSTLAGLFVQYFSLQTIQQYIFLGIEYDNKLIVATMLVASLFTICYMGLFFYATHYVLTHKVYITKAKKPSELKTKITLAESFKIIFSSKYLGLLIILIFSYGVSINIIEGVWKSKAKEIYATTTEFSNFTGNVLAWTGVCSMLFMLLSAHILRIFGWFVGAMFTPIMMLITGGIFFTFVVFHNTVAEFFSTWNINILATAVLLGTIQNVLTKGTKYSLFDATKEMAYIPANEHIKSKGKAAVDVVGARGAKSGGAFIQSLLFMIFPTATYSTIAPYLMIVFIIVVIVWIYGVKKLNISYQYRLSRDSEH